MNSFTLGRRKSTFVRTHMWKRLYPINMFDAAYKKLAFNSVTRRGVNKPILGICQCLLDISAHVDDEFVQRYGVSIGSAALANENQLPMYEEMQMMPTVEYIPGGSTLNSIRIAQWILGSGSTYHQTGFIGAIGDDVQGEYIEKICNREGVLTCLMKIPNLPSGICAVCVRNGERALVANLGAACESVHEHIMTNEELLNSAGIVYSSGFFLNCDQGRTNIFAAERTLETGAVFCINLSAAYIPKKYPRELARLISLSDYVFGNDQEAEAYGESIGLEDTSVRNVAWYIANLSKEKDSARTVIFTQGADCVIVARSDGLFLEIPIIPIPKKRIVDLNAAGDSFVGGFLAALSVGRDCVFCVKTGLLAASYIIQQSGCSFSGDFYNETATLAFKLN